jgi:F0F1-type ATP synthase membrane subunit b/b'
MSQDLVLLTLVFFVVLCWLTMLAQAFVLYQVFKVAKTMQAHVSTVLPQAKSILAKADSIIADSRQNIVDITAKANEISAKAAEMTQKGNEIMDLARAQVLKIDAVVTDASNRAKSQLERAEMVVDDTVSRVHQSVTAVHSGILKPIREINAVTAGVKTAVSVFLRGGRPSVAQATQDDEMFI